MRPPRNLAIFCSIFAAAIAGSAPIRADEPAPAPAISTRPNIVLILTDDQRFDLLGFMGHPFLETPHLDALAKGGMVFENAFVTTALCSPSRASILTGQYAHRHGVLDNVTALPPETPIFPEELRKGGYETAFIGKWHMGGESAAPRPGFDRWISFRGQGVYTDPVLNVDGEEKKHPGYITDLLTDFAEEYIRRPREKPFFLFLSHKAVHHEFAPADRHKGSYKDKTYPPPASMADTDENYKGKPDWVRAQRNSWHGVDGMYNGATHYEEFTRDFAETMRAVDDSVGRVTAALRERGLLENTLVIFTSDNGTQLGEHGLIDKRTMYEASIRVPMIVGQPGRTAPGSRRKEMVLNLDIGPTLLEAAGIAIPPTMQGRSFHGLLSAGSGPAPGPWREAFLYEYLWERSFPQTPTVLGVRTDRYKFMQYHGVWDRYEMYDLEADPGEMNNLLGDYKIGTEAGTLDGLISRKAPEPLKTLFKEMNGKLKRLLKETGAATEPNWRGVE